MVALLTTPRDARRRRSRILADFDYDHAGTLQFDVNKRWIDVINSRYHVGIDGISLPLLAAVDVHHRRCASSTRGTTSPSRTTRRRSSSSILILETGMNGTFVAQDLILFFVFFEIVLLPMFFMIGVWGGRTAQYASIKFFLFTLFGSALMLLSASWRCSSRSTCQTSRSTRFDMVAAHARCTAPASCTARSC